LRHWQQEPPVDALFAAFVGYKAPPRRGETASRSAAANEKVGKILSMFPSGDIRAWPTTGK
jgi:hypothetical protein